MVPLPFRKLREESFYYVLHPSPTVVIISKCPDGKINAMPASWNMPVSEEPPTVAVAIDRESYTYKCLEANPSATVNIPDVTKSTTTYLLGTVSGRTTDKVREFNLRLEPSEIVDVPRWTDAIAVIEGEVWKKLDVGEVRLYIFRVLGTYVKEGVFGRYGWDLTKVSPLLHGVGRVFYAVGKKVVARRK